MSEHFYVPSDPPHDKGELMKIFSAYGFRDKEGHSLLLCHEFLSLVNNYCGIFHEAAEHEKIS